MSILFSENFEENKIDFDQERSPSPRFPSLRSGHVPALSLVSWLAFTMKREGRIIKRNHEGERAKIPLGF